MSSQEDDQDDIQDEVFEEYSSISSGSRNYELRIADSKSSQQQEQEGQEISYKEQSSQKEQQKFIYRPADDEDIVQICMTIAQNTNSDLNQSRKARKEKFKEIQNQTLAAKANLKDYDMPYQTAHFPLILRSKDKFVMLPAQNLNIRKGTVESFIKLNTDNESQVKKAEQERRLAYRQRRPYQRRKFDIS